MEQCSMLCKERWPQWKPQRQISLSIGRNSRWDLCFAWGHGSLPSNSYPDKGPPVLRPSGSQVESLGRETTTNRLNSFVVCAGFLKEAWEWTGKVRALQVNAKWILPWLRSRRYNFQLCSQHSSCGCIDSICSGKWCNCFTSSTKINVCISSEHINEQQLYNLSFLMALELNIFGSEVIGLAKLASLSFE